MSVTMAGCEDDYFKDMLDYYSASIPAQPIPASPNTKARNKNKFAVPM